MVPGALGVRLSCGEEVPMRPAALVLCGVLFATAGCGERTTNPGADAAVDGHIHLDAPHWDATGGDRFQVDGPPQADGPTDGPAGDVLPPLDARWDAVVHVPDGGAPTAACATAGGVLCTPYRWEICPAGTEPLAGADPHLGCGNGGWCCVVAPPSTCSH
jgi:hypothetical protein